MTDKAEIEVLVKLLQRPYGNLTGGERQSVATALTALQAQLAAAVARAEKAEGALSGLSSYLGAGMGDDDTSAQSYRDRIMWGIDYQCRAVIQLAADKVEHLSKRPTTTWGEVKSAILDLRAALPDAKGGE